RYRGPMFCPSLRARTHPPGHGPLSACGAGLVPPDTERFMLSATLARAGVLQRGQQRLQIEPGVVPYTVDEEGGRAIHPTAHPAHEVLAHARRVAMRGHLALKPIRVVAHCTGIMPEMAVF